MTIRSYSSQGSGDAGSRDDGQGTVIEGGVPVHGTDVEGGTPLEVHEVHVKGSRREEMTPDQEISQEIGKIVSKYEEQEKQRSRADTSNRTKEGSKDASDKMDAEIHVVVTRVRKQQIEKAKAAGKPPNVITVERRF